MFSSVRRTGEEFADPDVVRCYALRPPYPDELHQRLLGLAAGRNSLLDLGCGPGKLANALAPHFQQVTAVDPSASMLGVARASQGADANIAWIEGRSEDVELQGPFDLAVVGAAIHWMRPEIVMPKLQAALRETAPLALVDGDAPSEATWIEAYQAHVIHWVEKGGAIWRDPAKTRPEHLNWIDIQGQETFIGEVEQSVEDLIEVQHSRATWSRATMGIEAAQEFDRELRAILQDHAIDGQVSYRVKTNLVFGRPLSSR